MDGKGFVDFLVSFILSPKLKQSVYVVTYETAKYLGGVAELISEMKEDKNFKRLFSLSIYRETAELLPKEPRVQFVSSLPKWAGIYISSKNLDVPEKEDEAVQILCQFYYEIGEIKNKTLILSILSSSQSQKARDMASLIRLEQDTCLESEHHRKSSERKISVLFDYCPLFSLYNPTDYSRSKNNDISDMDINQDFLKNLHYNLGTGKTIFNVNLIDKLEEFINDQSLPLFFRHYVSQGYARLWERELERLFYISRKSANSEERRMVEYGIREMKRVASIIQRKWFTDNSIKKGESEKKKSSLTLFDYNGFINFIAPVLDLTEDKGVLQQIIKPTVKYLDDFVANCFDPLVEEQVKESVLSIFKDTEKRINGNVKDKYMTSLPYPLQIHVCGKLIDEMADRTIYHLTRIFFEIGRKRSFFEVDRESENARKEILQILRNSKHPHAQETVDSIEIKDSDEETPAKKAEFLYSYVREVARSCTPSNRCFRDHFFTTMQFIASKTYPYYFQTSSDENRGWMLKDLETFLRNNNISPIFRKNVALGVIDYLERDSLNYHLHDLILKNDRNGNKITLRDVIEAALAEMRSIFDQFNNNQPIG